MPQPARAPARGVDRRSWCKPIAIDNRSQTDRLTHAVASLQLHYLLFIIAGPFAGSALNVYSAIPEWDAIVHYDSGIMLAWLGMLSVRRAEERAEVILPRWFELTVVQLMAMAFAAAWEICEFLSDRLIGTVSQPDLADTMSDIMLGTAGGLTGIVILVLLRRPRLLLPLSFVPTSRADG